jgi:HAE1 family hydrophobic/amphiphilic exporter-1
MLLTRLSITRPLIVLTAIATILVMGLFAWANMGVNLLPKLDFPVVTITTVYPGAGPEAVDTLVTRKIEDAVAGMNEIDYIQSISSEGVSSVLIFFTEKAPKDVSTDVERRVSAVRSELPTDAKVPTIDKYDPNAEPIMQLSVSGSRDLGELQRLAEDKIKGRLEATSGVARVSLLGGLEREIQVLVDQRKLQARGLSILQVNQALAGDNLNVPAGTLTQRGQDWSVRLNNQAQSVEEMKDILVSVSPTGVPVHLGDVATVVDTYKKVSVHQRTDGKAAVGVAIVKQASANTIQTADLVKAELNRLKADLPAGMDVNIVSDQSIFTRHSVEDVQHELSLAILLTGLVLLAFLHTFRSTLIVLLSIPTSLIATLGVMYAMGLSFNMMSLMGLTLTVGILVDDSIVVLENIFRHLQMGEEPREAAVNGRSEIGMAAIAITLVDVVVFTPIAFMSGITGQYFREFGLVIATATLFSLFISFTLTPMLASRWYRRGDGAEGANGVPTRNPIKLFGRVWDRGYARLEHGYARVLRAALRYRWLAVGAGVASFVGGVSLAALGILPSEFMPASDEGWVQVTLDMPAGTTLDATDAATHKLEARAMAWPETKTVFTTVGTSGGFFGGAQARSARIQVELKDRKERKRTTNDLAAEARTFGQDLPGATVKSQPISMFGGGFAPIAVRITGEDQKVLTSLATQVAAAVRKVPGAVDVSDGGVTGQPELLVSVDRRRAADLGLTPGQVASVLRTGLAGSTVGTFRPEGTKGWDVTVLLNPEERASVEQVSEIPIVTPRGATVRLGQVAQVTTVSGPTQVTRRDRARAVTVSAGIEGRVLSEVTQEIDRALAGIQVPAGYAIKQGGEAEDQAESFTQIFQALGLSAVLMYMLMMALFESMLFPLIVMLSLPLAVVGAFGLLTLTGNTLNMMSMIGLILLMGLVGKNAILLIDYTNGLRKRGIPRDQALLAAGPARLRPILMTTAALVLAMLPLALRLGEGSEWRAPMAVTVIGGLLTSTLLTLVMIPAVYTLMDDLQSLVRSLPRRIRYLVHGRGHAQGVAGQAGASQDVLPVAGGSE